MSLARSASGPGGLSINTGAANLFGSSTSQPPAAGGLFGSGAAAATSQPSAPGSGGLFGAGSTAAHTATSAFGNTAAAATSQPQRSATLFGMSTPAAASSTTQTQPGGALFGAAAAGATTQQPQQSGGLFGSLSTATSTPQPTGGLFGTALGQPPRTGGLLGSTTQVQPQQTTSGLFGTSTQPQPAAAGGLFGAASTTGTASLLGKGTQLGGTSTWGQPRLNTGSSDPAARPGQLLNSQTVPGVRIDSSNIRGTTRFNDLHEDIQQEIAKIDKIIEMCMAQKHELDAFMPAHGEQLAAIPPDVRFISRKAGGVDGALNGDAQAVKALQDLVKVDADHARLSFKAIDNLKLPAQYHTAGLWSTRGQTAAPAGTDGEGDNSDLIGFFSTTADEMSQSMAKFGQNLSDVETHLRGLESNLREQVGRLTASSTVNGRPGADDRAAELAAVLTDFEASILQVAGVVGGAREKMTELQLAEFT